MFLILEYNQYKYTVPFVRSFFICDDGVFTLINSLVSCFNDLYWHNFTDKHESVYLKKSESDNSAFSIDTICQPEVV